MVFKKPKGNLFYLIFFALLLGLILNIIFYYRGTYIIDNGLGLALLNWNSFTQTFWSWTYLNYTGLMNIPNTNILTSLLGAIGLTINDLFGIAANQIYNSVLLKAIDLFGMFLLVTRLTKGYGKTISFVSGIFASILFTFHFESQPGFLSTPGTFLPFVLLSGLYLIYDIENKTNKTNLDLSLFAVSTALFFGIGGFGYAVQNMLFLIVLFIIFILLSKNSVKLSSIKYLGSGVLLALLINLPWILITYFFTKNIAYTQYFNGLSKYFLGIYKINILQSFLLFGPNYGIGLFNYIYLLIIFILAVIGALLFVKGKNKTLEQKFVFSIFSVYIFITAVSLSINKPFGVFYSKLLSTLPYLEAFRYPYPSFHYLMIFSVTLFLGITIAYLLNFFNKLSANNLKKYAFLGFVLTTLIFITLTVFYVYEFDYVPAANTVVTTPNNTALSVYYGLPKHIFEISKFINNQKGFFNVAILPVTQGSELNKNYVGPSVYSWLINDPIFTGGYTTAQAFFPPSIFEYYYYPGNYIDSYNHSSEMLNKNYVSKTLGIFGIKYIIIQGNALEKVNCSICTITPFSFNSIYYVLNNSYNISFVSRFNKSTVYKNGNYVQLVYPSKIIEANSISQVFSIIGNMTFNIHNTSLFTRNMTILNAYGPTTGNLSFYSPELRNMSFYSIANFSKPNISFVEDTPTKVTVHVSNATTPYYLVFRETYDPHWAAFYSNGTEVNPRDHIAVNGFANAWYMNKTGNYTITLYYTLQTDAWIAWGVSFAALFVTIGIGVYGWKETRKTRRGNKR
jgi:hypothetical protein